MPLKSFKNNGDNGDLDEENIREGRLDMIQNSGHKCGLKLGIARVWSPHCEPILVFIIKTERTRLLRPWLHLRATSL